VYSCFMRGLQLRNDCSFAEAEGQFEYDGNDMYDYILVLTDTYEQTCKSNSRVYYAAAPTCSAFISDSFNLGAER
jgi:hypothetical protein